MAEVPRIVRERLRGQTVAGEHPDANLLSAFAERTLTETERDQVLDHLSRCADCREVVALAALPQVEEERLVAAAAAGRAPVAAGRSWWRSPIVHWSALTAAALVVLIAVGERMRLRREYSASAPAIASYEMAKKQAAPAPLPPPPPQPNESQKLAETTRAPRQAEAVNPPRSAGGVSGARMTASGSSRSIVAGKAAAPAPPPPTSNYGSGYSSGIGNSPPPEQERKIDQPQTKAVPTPTATTSDALEAARPGGVVAGAVVPKSESATLAQRSGANFTRRALLVPRWSVSNSGALQRSFDGGRSWREVAVAEGVSLRAVAVVVRDVWAGGSGGALFHSSDGGEHWARVQVQANDRTLSGDIVRIEFADAQNGVVVTSTGETWRTSDAGGTWRQ